MVADYTEFVDIADEVLGEWGSSGVTWVKPGTPGAYDPTTGYYASGTTDIYVSVKAVFSAVDQKMAGYTSLGSTVGSGVLIGDVKITMSSKGLISYPGVGDWIFRNTEKFKIVNTINAKPADTNVVLIYHARAD